ncbi:sigma-70 family RNA polymerase sigma factor [Nocardiopsis sp. NPDC006139]|uniref:sigma-70 family RNA polymerase sigma factor n=1 Tax=Nocardiopsis sp. NPDC006139 TaxID=3154578 RepID=UPI0033A4DC8B
MTQTHDAPDPAKNEAPEPTAAEIEAWERENFFLPADEATPETHPALYNISAGLMMFAGVVRPLDPQLPDYVTIPMFHASTELIVEVSKWNVVWEAGQFRRRFFSVDDLPEPIAKIAELGDINTILVPYTLSRYFEYAPLFHLLPKDTLDRFGLPILRRGQWPFIINPGDADRFLPADFEQRLAKAWAWSVWPHINSGSPMQAFSGNDPIRILSHNLNYWVPPVTKIIQDTLGKFPEVDKGKTVGPVPLEDGSFLPGAVTGNPRQGGSVWTGKDEAAEMVAATVEAADATGNLRGIMDAVRSHRVEDDFSGRWSYAREDFERKLYRKRSKVQVRFVELTDTIPVQGPESEVLGKLVTSDFLALLNEKQREVVVLLNSGFRQHEIAEKLGYANHSPISKRLTQVQRKAVEFFGLDK